jgi:hypothetical protein
MRLASNLEGLSLRTRPTLQCALQIVFTGPHCDDCMQRRYDRIVVFS